MIQHAEETTADNRWCGRIRHVAAKGLCPLSQPNRVCVALQFDRARLAR
jgi:hypothetical protein